MPEDTTNVNTPVVDATATTPAEEVAPVMDAPVVEEMPAAPVAPEVTPETPAAAPAY